MPRIGRKVDTCPYNAATQTLKILGGRWKVVVIQLLLTHKTLRYSEIRDRIPDITEKMLSTVLADLTADGLIDRDERKSKEPKVVFYALTDLGQKTDILIAEMVHFGSHFNV